MICALCGQSQSKEGLVLLEDKDGRIVVCHECLEAFPPFLRPDLRPTETPASELRASDNLAKPTVLDVMD